MSSIPRRSEHEKILSRLPEGPGRDYVARLLARRRHEARVEATAKTAGLADWPQITPSEAACRAFTWLYFDLTRWGGHRDEFWGEATVRLPQFRELGKGRWLAVDGGAYRAAALEVLYRLRDPFGFREFHPDPQARGVIFRAYALREEVLVPFPEEFLSDVGRKAIIRLLRPEEFQDLPQDKEFVHWADFRGLVENWAKYIK